jgi:argininosuccinate lyase
LKLWGGCFDHETQKTAFDFQSSIHIDQRLYKEDITGSIAHAKTLHQCGVLSEEEVKIVEKTLIQMMNEIDEGKLKIDQEHEDIHTFVEVILTERIGDLGKKIHTGRSRNDQVATDFRLYVAKEIDQLIQKLKRLENTLIDISNQNLDTIISGYTHLQKAQPITVAHHFMAYFEMFKRDIKRLLDLKERVLIMPLGSGALAGTSFPLDREYTKTLLGFKEISLNSLDAVSDRDFVIELSSDLSIVMMHLSRFCEEIILWASQEFNYILLDEGYCTGSSIMPQKINPDVAELIRGKTGRVYGATVSLLTMMKSLPLAYNKDMQEDKEVIFDSIDTVKTCLEIFTGMIGTLTFRKERMLESSEEGYTNATDLADYLVKKGISFRDSHVISGQIVNYALKNKQKLRDISLEEFRNFSEKIEEDVYEKISVEECVNARDIIGGPAKKAMMKTMALSKQYLESLEGGEA